MEVFTSFPPTVFRSSGSDESDDRNANQQTGSIGLESDWEDEDASDDTSEDENSLIDDDSLPKGFWDEQLTPGGPSYMMKPDSRQTS